MIQQTCLEGEVAKLIVDAVSLETPAEAIDPEIALFASGLGLDSIDLLEVALAVSQKYGFQLRSDDSSNERVFASVRALSTHIAEHRTR